MQTTHYSFRFCYICLEISQIVRKKVKENDRILPVICIDLFNRFVGKITF